VLLAHGMTHRQSRVVDEDESGDWPDIDVGLGIKPSLDVPPSAPQASCGLKISEEVSQLCWKGCFILLHKVWCALDVDELGGLQRLAFPLQFVLLPLQRRQPHLR